MSRGIIAGGDWEMEGLGILGERGKCVIGKGLEWREFVWKDGTSECGAGGWIFGARVMCSRSRAGKKKNARLDYLHAGDSFPADTLHED